MEEEKRLEPIGFLFKQIDRQVHRTLQKAPAISSAEKMTGTHAWVISFLHRNSDRDMFQRDLEKAFDINRSSVTGILQLMEKNGLITREAVPGDARLKKICLTEKALELDESVQHDLDEFDLNMVRGFTEEEIRLLRSYLNRVRENINEAENELEMRNKL